MKPFPVKRIGALVDLFVEACQKAPDADVVVELEGAYGLDKAGDLGLAALAEGDVPVDLPVAAAINLTMDRKWEALGMGRFHLRLHRSGRTDT